MRIAVIILAFALVALTSCGGQAGSSNSSANAKRYQLRGKVVSVNRTAKKATIDHEKIPGYMDAMTMEFPVHADWVWDEMQPDAEIRADLVVDNTAKEPFWLENVGIIAAAKPGQTVPIVNEHVAQVGSEVPDFNLTNQDGKKITIKDFRGKALAITFIYSRCPLPNYCILMSTNFSDMANQLAMEPDFRDKIRLLSISFDPANDTPEKLRSYGLGYLGQGARNGFSVWQLAVGKDDEIKKIADFFGLRYEVDENDNTVINHSLRTAVIGPDGKVRKVFAGNEWTPAEVIEELKASLK